MDTKTATPYFVKVYRASMRGWHYCAPHAHIRVHGCYTTAALTKTAHGWSASANWNGQEYRADSRRGWPLTQMDAAIALAELISSLPPETP